MIVCVCRKVSDRQIRQAVADGAHSLDCLEFELGVASQCGRCADCASQVLCEARKAAAATTMGAAIVMHGPASHHAGHHAAHRAAMQPAGA